MRLSRVGHVVDGAVHRVRLSGDPLGAREVAEVVHVLQGVHEDGDARVVVLESAGHDFCPGAAQDLDPLDWAPSPADLLAGLRQPVVAALGGRVGSVGLELALAADIRVAASDARFSVSDVTAGHLPCWGGTVRLPRAVGRPLATSMLLLGTELSAERAHAAGLVADVVDPGGLSDAVSTTAGRLAALAPLALELAKEAIARGDELPMRSALVLEGDLNHLLQTTADRAEGLQAFLDKRDAEFTGR